jgi:elongation factor Ts
MTTANMSFTPKDVMALREKTGLGMMDCKAALAEAGGDPKKAEELLRAKMKGKMDTRTERQTGEGRVVVVVQGSDAAIVEVKCETDFTARNDDFNKMVQDVAKLVLNGPVGAATATDAIKKRVDDVRITTGENMSFSRGEHLRGGSFGQYIHHDGKRGALVQVEGGAVDQAVLNGIATHVVGYHPSPIGISGADVPAATLEEVRRTAIAEAKETGKPDQIAQKMAEGRVGKYLKENTLLDQPYVKDPTGKQAVKDLLPKGASIKKFVRYVVGG